jgi:hypothetical protein
MQRATGAIGVAALFICCESIAVPSPEQPLASLAHVSECIQAAPKPYYSDFTAAHHFRGSGVFVLRIRVDTGRVVEVRVARSTGHASLDSAAVRALIIGGSSQVASNLLREPTMPSSMSPLHSQFRTRPYQMLERTADRRENLLSLTSTQKPEAWFALVGGRSACFR